MEETNNNYSYFDNKDKIKFDYEFKVKFPIKYYVIGEDSNRIHDEQKLTISDQILQGIEQTLLDGDYINEYFPKEDKIQQCYLDVNEVYDDIEMYFGFITDKDVDVNTLKEDIKIFMENLNSNIDYDSSINGTITPGIDDNSDGIELDPTSIAFRPNKSKPIQITQINNTKEINEAMDKELVTKGKLYFVKENESKMVNLTDDGEVELYENKELKNTIPFSKTGVIKECKDILAEGYILQEQEETENNTNTDGTPDIDVQQTKKNLEQGIKDVDELQNLKDELNDKMNNLVNESVQDDLYVLVLYTNVNNNLDPDVIIDNNGVVQDDLDSAPKYSKEEAEQMAKNLNDNMNSEQWEIRCIPVNEATKMKMLNETKQLKLENLKDDSFPSTEFTQRELTPLEVNKLDCQQDLSIEQCAWIITHFDSLDNFEESFKQFINIISVGDNIPFISIDEYISGLLQERSI